MKQATIIPSVDGKTFRLMLGDHELGVSKTDFDARFHLNAINDALQVAFLEGQKYLERMVERQRVELELQTVRNEMEREHLKRRLELWRLEVANVPEVKSENK